MSIEIDLPPEWEARLREEAARHGQEAPDYASDLVKRQLVLRELEALKERKPPQSLADLQPRIPAPPGTTWLESLRGQWPGDETDEEIDRALDELS
jgi:hypothetical protein